MSYLNVLLGIGVKLGYTETEPFVTWINDLCNVP